jgi:hypothetical protein
MVRPERLELPTLCSEGRCSIHLSYGRVPESILRQIRVCGTWWEGAGSALLSGLRARTPAGQPAGRRRYADSADARRCLSLSLLRRLGCCPRGLHFPKELRYCVQIKIPAPSASLRAGSVSPKNGETRTGHPQWLLLHFKTQVREAVGAFDLDDDGIAGLQVQDGGA